MSLDSRFLTNFPRPQPLSASFYPTKIIVMRKALQAGHTLFDGPLGVNVTQYNLVVRGWPGGIVPRSSQLINLPQGQTELGDHLLTTQYRRMQDGGLLIRERDVITDMKTGVQYLVLWSHDPMDTGIQITAGLQSGVVAASLSEQS
jgi:hypothetical protein